MERLACTSTRRDQLLVNGSADGLVEVTIEPPCHTDRTPSTMFVEGEGGLTSREPR